MGSGGCGELCIHLMICVCITCMDAEVDAEREMGAMRDDMCCENEQEVSLFSWQMGHNGWE